MFFNTMYNVVDTLFAGFISTEAIAALSISFPLFFIILSFTQGLSTGAAALISNALGRGDEISTEKISAQVLVFAFFCYLAILAIGLTASQPLFQLLGASGAYLEMARAYMDVIFWGSLFFIFLYAANAILIAHGNSRTMRNYLVLGFFLNAALDPWFLFGGFGLPAMGLAGIALATVVTVFLGCCYILYTVTKSGFLRIVSWRDFIPHPPLLKELAVQSFPASLNMMTVGIGIFVIQYFLKPWGSSAMAAYGICMRIEQIVLLPSIGLTVATLAIVGQNNGAHRFDRIRQTVRLACRYGFFLTLIGLLLIFVYPQPLIALFNNTPEVMDLGVTYLRIASLNSYAYILLGIFISALQGMKHPAFPFAIGLSRQIIVPFLLFPWAASLGLLAIWWTIFGIVWTAAFATIMIFFWMIKRDENTRSG